MLLFTTPIWFTSSFLKGMPVIALERESGEVDTLSPSKSEEVTSKDDCLDGMGLILGTQLNVCVHFL